MKSPLFCLLALVTVSGFAQNADTSSDGGLKFPEVRVVPPDNTSIPPPPAVGANPQARSANSATPAAAPARSAQTETVQLSNAPQIVPTDQRPGPTPGVAVSQPTSRADIHRLKAVLNEPSFPETVRRDGNGNLVPVNLPVGWKLVPLRSLRFDPPPSITLANGETYAVESSPMVLVPESNSNKVAINPRALQVIYNFHLMQLELLRQLQESLQERPSTPVQ